MIAPGCWLKLPEGRRGYPSPGAVTGDDRHMTRAGIHLVVAVTAYDNSEYERTWAWCLVLPGLFWVLAYVSEVMS